MLDTTNYAFSRVGKCAVEVEEDVGDDSHLTQQIRLDTYHRIHAGGVSVYTYQDDYFYDLARLRRAPMDMGDPVG